MKFDYKIIGLELLKKKCEKSTIQEPVNEGIKKLAVWMVKTVKVSTPVDTGRLRSSVSSQVYGSTAKIGTNVQYAQYVEYGTRYIEPRYVKEGSSARILGTGPFTYAMELLQGKIKDFLGEIGKAISVRFG